VHREEHSQDGECVRARLSCNPGRRATRHFGGIGAGLARFSAEGARIRPPEVLGMTRRFFLKSSAVAMAGVGSAPAWLSRALYAADAPSPRKKILVAVFQRGAVDGLNVVVPFGEQRYYDLWPNLAIPKPNGGADGAIDLNGFFGLHPALAPLAPLYRAGHL